MSKSQQVLWRMQLLSGDAVGGKPSGTCPAAVAVTGFCSPAAGDLAGDAEEGGAGLSERRSSLLWSLPGQFRS